MPATTLADRAVVRLSGTDVRGFLQVLVTNDVTGALPVWSGLLSPQGKCLADFLIWDDGDDILIDCDAEATDDLVKRLSLYRMRLPITIEPDHGLAVHWSRDGDAAAFPIPGSPPSAGVGSLLRASQSAAGGSIASASACAKAWPSSAMSSGSNAMRPS